MISLYELSFPMSGLKGLCCTAQHADCCSEPSAIRHPHNTVTMLSPGRGQQQYRLQQSLPASGPAGTALTDRCRRGSGLFSSLLLWACSWDATAAPAGLASTEVTASGTPQLSLCALLSGISCLWLKLPGARLCGLQLGFLPLPRETSAVLQWPH